MTAVFSILATSFFILSFKSTIKEQFYLVFILLSFLLWFLPSINVRFSSEVWAGLILLLSVALINKNKSEKRYFLMIGILLGLSFEFRFQMGLCIAGIMIWFLIIKKIPHKKWFIIMSGIFAVVIICTVIDSFYYQKFVFAPYNYFKVDLLDNVVNSYGIEPWYYYIVKIMETPTLIIGIPIILSIIYLLVKDYKNIILWCILPYLIVHSIIGHKEIRYFFPIVHFVPILLIWFIQDIFDLRKSAVYRTFINFYFAAFFLVNIGGLFVLFKPAGSGAVNLAHYIQKKYFRGSPVTIYSPYYGAYSIGNAKGWIQRFYMKDEIELRFIEADFLDKIEKNSENELLITIPKGYFREIAFLEAAGYEIEKESIPVWIGHFNNFYRVYDENSVLLLYTKNLPGKNENSTLR